MCPPFSIYTLVNPVTLIFLIVFIWFVTICSYRGRVIVERNDLVVINQYLGFSKKRWIPFKRILGVEAGEKGLTIRLRNGRSYNVGFGINSKPAAKRIAEQIMQAVNDD